MLFSNIAFRRWRRIFTIIAIVVIFFFFSFFLMHSHIFVVAFDFAFYDINFSNLGFSLRRARLRHGSLNWNVWSLVGKRTRKDVNERCMNSFAAAKNALNWFSFVIFVSRSREALFRPIAYAFLCIIQDRFNFSNVMCIFYNICDAVYVSVVK